MKRVQVLIAGAGMAGISTAIWCKRLGLSCLVIEKAIRLVAKFTIFIIAFGTFPQTICKWRGIADRLA
ncbi:FAD-binding protein [Brevibacillus laterosporus]